MGILGLFPAIDRYVENCYYLELRTEKKLGVNNVNHCSAMQRNSFYCVVSISVATEMQLAAGDGSFFFVFLIPSRNFFKYNCQLKNQLII